MVGCSDLSALTDCFAWFKTSFKLFIQVFFCLLLTFVYFIYWFSVHLLWNLSLGVLANFHWVVSKPDIRTPPPTGLWRVMTRVTIFEISPVVINILTGFKSITPSSSCWVLLSLFSVVEEVLIYKHNQWRLRVGPRGTKAHWVNPWQIFLLAAN